jgi:hypothetical protein
MTWITLGEFWPPLHLQSQVQGMIIADAGVEAAPHAPDYPGDHSLCAPGYPGDLPCPTKGAAIQNHYDEDQGMLQRGTLGVRQER